MRPRANAASKTAFNASRAPKLDEFRSLAADLRRQCDGCDGLYMKTG